MTRIAVLVSGGGTNLQALIDAQREGRLCGGEICAVISSKDNAYALERARLAGIPSDIVRRKDFPDIEKYTSEVVSALEDYDADLVVHAGYLSVLSPEYCERYRGRALNIHPALIPSFCGKGYYGLHVHEEVLAYGVKLTGATVHFIDETADGGPIIAQKAIPILPDDTPETLQQRVMAECEQPLLKEAVALFCAGRLRVEGRIVQVVSL